MPPLPPPYQALLVRVTTTGARQTARRQLREAARTILADWSGAAAQLLPWLETARGPIWEGAVDGHSVSMSFSYTDDAGWVGLVRGGTVGVDAMRARSFSEMEAVARLYLGPASWAAIQATPDPARAFATTWTELEARIKCLGRDLVEWPGLQAASEIPCVSHRILFPDGTMVTVATRDGTTVSASEVAAPSRRRDRVSC